ncbi:MAG TPA: 3-deoxy-manno-octulosonate cytidylyltransferase [Kiritimatiellia bacterium]|nr:3-deoxy-manno-octulosonate cytidylyltransferase [Kiritimatiellia bacterium]HMO97838.1 3-deoxy-manno-octulosonate cytidylyltransferase [Kiritimatiellia bacterium]HMP98012.1 3-deoxy-manno-octulosonate cytidylyltransferase [Kiritimatiellia bacterium]
MKTIGVIPARYGSTRLPGKSLVAICGKPLVQWVYERARLARRLDGLVVATDDSRIVQAVEAFGGVAVMTRSDHPSGTDRIAEAVAGRQGDIVINIQGDEPLIDPALIDQLANVMTGEGDWDMATAVCPIHDAADLENPAVVKAVWAADGRALYFSRAPIPFLRDQHDPPAGLQHWRHIGIYAYRRAFLDKLVKTPPCVLELTEKLEQLRALDLGGRIRVVTTEEAGLGVDTPEDVPKAEAALRAAGLG